MEDGHRRRQYQIIEEEGMGEIEEKKSRFIAHVAPVFTEEEAQAFIEAKKKEYWDARHNCYAYSLGEEGQTVRFSDDGEPSGTAGRPILEVINGSEIRNLVIVVTRYFGGTLLGTGGLVRAYTQAAQAGLAACRRAFMCYGYKITLVTDYNGIGKIQYLLGQRGIPIEDSSYEEQVTVTFYLSLEEKDTALHELTEATAGKITIDISEPLYYKKTDGAR